MTGQSLLSPLPSTETFLANLKKNVRRRKRKIGNTDWEFAQLSLPTKEVITPLDPHRKLSENKEVDLRFFLGSVEKSRSLKKTFECCGYYPDEDKSGDKDGITYRSKITVPVVYFRLKCK